METNRPTLRQPRRKGGPPVQNSFDTSTNRLSNIGGSVTPSYDASGDLTSDGTTTYTWDAEGRLIKANTPTNSNATYTYAYNGLGQLVYSLTEYSYSSPRSPDDREYIYDPAGNVISLTNSLATSSVEPFSLDSLPSPYSFYQNNDGLNFDPLDSLGSTTSVGNGYNLFYPWGKDWESCELYGNNYPTFSGCQAMYCPCLDWLPDKDGAYNTAQGRWMDPTDTQPDAADPESLNPYNYGDNDPVSPPGSDDQGKAPLSPKDQQRYEKARKNLLEQLRDVSEPCADLLSQIGDTPDMVRDAVRRQKPWNGKKSCIKNREAGTFGGPRPIQPDAAKTYDFMMEGPVSLNFRETPGETTWAVAQKSGADVYFRPGGPFSMHSANPATILHEALHNLGKTDKEIKKAWHLPEDTRETDDITRKLREADCVRN